MNTVDLDIKKILLTEKIICVIGLNPDAFKPSHQIPMFMKKNGYEILGVYPKPDPINGCAVYTELSKVPAEKLKFINVFRKSEAIPEIVDELIRLGHTKILWLQLGITHVEAEKKAEAHGMQVISDRCMLIEYNKWISL
jgi:uncharacterized protein